MLNIEMIENILKDWKNGATHGEILGKYPVTRLQEFGITLHSPELNVEQILERALMVKPGMNSREVIKIFKGV